MPLSNVFTALYVAVLYEVPYMDKYKLCLYGLMVQFVLEQSVVTLVFTVQLDWEYFAIFLCGS